MRSIIKNKHFVTTAADLLKFAISAAVLALLFWLHPEQAVTLVSSTGAFVLGRSGLTGKIGL